MKLKVLIDDVKEGMFVSELDRPWLDTPFLFQGFVIDNQEQIDDLRIYCQFVFVDPEVIPDSRPKVAVGVSTANSTVMPEPKSVAAGNDFSIFEEKNNHVYSSSPTGMWMADLRAKYPPQSLMEVELPAARKIFESAGKAAHIIFKDAVATGVLDTEKLQESMADVTESVIRNPDALLLLSYLKKKSSYSYDHAISVSIHLLAFGRYIGLAKDQLQMLGAAGLLLDVGMMRIPESLVQKNERLSGVEYKFMRRHVQFSVEMIQANPGLNPQIADIIAQHHERENGSGYPQGLKEREITPFAKMAAIVDCFVALISERPYAEAVTPMNALSMLYNWRDDFYQADMVEQFIQCLGPYPVGSFVELNTGEVAVVLAHNRTRRLKPKVMIVLDAAKKPYAAPVLLDLINDPQSDTKQIYAIKASIPDGVHEIDLKEFYL